MAAKGVLGTVSGVCLMLALVVDPGVAQMRAAEGSARAVSIPPAAGVAFDFVDEDSNGSPAEN